MGGGCAEGGGAGAVATLGLGGMYNDVRRTTTKDRKKQGKYVHVEQTDDLCSSTKPKKKEERSVHNCFFATNYFFLLSSSNNQAANQHSLIFARVLIQSTAETSTLP